MSDPETLITIDHSDEYPYAYYGDDEGVTSANNPAFWYAMAMTKPNYQMPAIPMRVEYVFGYGLADGIFIRVSNWIVAGAYADGMQITYPIEN